MNFWQQLKNPIIGLAPMDGVTDVAYREIQAKYGDPGVIFTEFIPVEGIVRLNERLLQDFWYTVNQRPAIAQIYGNDPELFYASAQLVCELGFDGIDINMGCPARSVVHRGCGAALIRTPDLAVELIKAVQQAVADWQQTGINWERWPVLPGTIARQQLQEFIETSKQLGLYSDLEVAERKLLPVSVKTRVGFSEPVVESWIPTLLGTNPAAITIHGRTLKQMYTGQADWSLLTKAVELRDQIQADFPEKTLLLGSGDIKDLTSAREKIALTGLDGALIGRGTFGNPWVFKGQKPGLEEIFKVILEHAKLHQFYKEPRAFVQMRKNLAWYISGIPEAASLRSKLMLTNSAEEVEIALKNYLQN